MTGFAVARGECPLGLVTVEMRCVNSRFFDPTLRLADELRSAEPVVRELLAKRVNRGKLECRVSLKTGLDESGMSVDAKALAALAALQASVLEAMPDARPMSVAELLSYPGVLAQNSADPEAVNAAVAMVCSQALDAFTASRVREGAALSEILLKNCAQIDEIASAVEEKVPDIHAAVRAKLAERLSSGLTAALTETGTITREEVNDRIRQEVTLFALKMDVAEEINRLRTHTAEVRRILASGGPVGRRLDFVTQELNREANTLGSKAASIEMTDAAVALKISIDQMREQLQNLE